MKTLANILILWSIMFMFGFMFVSLFNPDILLPVIEWIKAKIEILWHWNYLIAFVSALLESLPIIGAVMPWQTVLLSVWGFYGATWTPQLIWVLIAAISGSMLSNWIGYILWKRYGEDFFKSYGMWFGIEQTELKYLKKWVNTWWPWGIILSKFHAHARAFLPFIAGSMGFAKKQFWIYNIIASCIWAIFFVLLWILFAEFYEIIIRYLWYAMIGIMLSILLYYYIFKREKLLAYWRDKNAEMEEKYRKKQR